MHEFHTHLSMATSQEYIEISKHTERTQYQLTISMQDAFVASLL